MTDTVDIQGKKTGIFNYESQHSGHRVMAPLASFPHERQSFCKVNTFLKVALFREVPHFCCPFFLNFLSSCYLSFFLSTGLFIYQILSFSLSK